ncbi:LodA/GoxA family CTQ-dependent oxidase [Nitrosospira multiformis]|nr:LodA/GoxA family CTQ-dependent oxidase [Nitrosospira multiformis]
MIRSHRYPLHNRRKGSDRMKTVARIYPAVGIAHIGNSEKTYFLAPESPGIVPAEPNRDNSGKIKPKPRDSGPINSFGMISARKPSTARSLGMKKQRLDLW